MAGPLSYAGIIWVEDAYPQAGTLAVLHGGLPYTDFQFDKPPVSLLVPLIWGAWAGIGPRLASAAFCLLCCGLASWLANSWAISRTDNLTHRSGGWSEPGWLAAVLMAVGMTFYIPSATFALAPDLLMIAPHLAAVAFARERRTLWTAAMVGLALWTNAKGALVAAACLAWDPRGAVLGVVLGAGQLLLPGNWEQVWAWGSRYSADTAVANPLAEGLARTANWMGFQAAAVLGTGCFFVAGGERRERARAAWWLAVSFAGVVAGLRFFPRYYFQLLPAVAVLGGVGLAEMARRRRVLAMVGLALVAIPMARFAPRMVQVALHGDEGWADTALNRDSREAAKRIQSAAGAGDTILVWGYRPDILVYTRLRLGTPFLDSQPLTGVLADRHLGSTRATFAEQAAANRRRLQGMRPTWVVDGLGPLNGRLAIPAFADLQPWLANYREFARTEASVIYRLRD